MTSNLSKGKRGRKKIPEQWSRVISIRHDDLKDLKVFDLGPDLTLINAMKVSSTRGKKIPKW